MKGRKLLKGVMNIPYSNSQNERKMNADIFLNELDLRREKKTKHIANSTKKIFFCQLKEKLNEYNG